MGASAFRIMRERNAVLANKKETKPEAKESELVGVNGVGKSTASKLEEAGISTIAQLAEAEAGDLVKQEWIDSAIELI